MRGDGVIVVQGWGRMVMGLAFPTIEKISSTDR